MHESGKALKMLQELMNYFIQRKLVQLTIEFELKPELTRMKVSAPCLDLPEDLERVRLLLAEPRKPEMEEYYWQLWGDNHNKSAIELLGLLVDEVKIETPSNSLSVELTRHHGTSRT